MKKNPKELMHDLIGLYQQYPQDTSTFESIEDAEKYTSERKRIKFEMEQIAAALWYRIPEDARIIVDGFVVERCGFMYVYKENHFSSRIALDPPLALCLFHKIAG